MFVLKVLRLVYLGPKWSHFKRLKILLWIYRKFQSKVLLSSATVTVHEDGACTRSWTQHCSVWFHNFVVC